MTSDTDMHRASDVLKDRPWYAARSRRWMKDATKTIITSLVMLAFLAIPFCRMMDQSPAPKEFPPPTVHELLEAIRPQIVEPGAKK